ncbi:MAG: chloride channel protein, partial [Bdellovibrionales bacterium]|nr:chloride channel protein [Bdellovibrionales bacterium]
LSYLSGIPGGIFSPTLSIGAGLGAIFANAVNSPYYQAFVLLGMVGFFSGVIRSPITAVIIVSEMTHNHNLLFALLMSSLAAYATSMAIQRESLYVALAKRYL